MEVVVSVSSVRRIVLGAAVAVCAAVAVQAHVHAQSPSPAHVFLDLVPLVRGGITTAEWQRAHPSENVEFGPNGASAKPAQETPYSCAVVSRVIDTSQGAARVNLFFYLPEPSDATVPSFGAGIDDVRRQCRAGLVTVVTDASTWSRDDEQTVVAALGQPQRGVLAFVQGLPFSTRDSLYWQSVPFTAFVSVRRPNPAIVKGATPQVVFAAAHDRAHQRLSLTDRRLVGLDSMRWRVSQARVAERAAEAIGLSGQPVDLQRVALSFAARFAANPTSPPQIVGAEADQMADLLAAWLDGAKGLSRDARAASLMAADALLDFSRSWWADAPAGAARARLEAHGAVFVPDPLGGSIANRHNWIRQAAALEPGGRIGDLLLLHQMERGFEFGLCTDQQGVGFRAVIREATAYLAAHPDSAIAGDVQLLLGDAWADIAALGAGFVPSEYADAKSYAKEAPAARANAIAAYRTGWVTAATSRQQYSWSTVWALLAGLPPQTMSFFCVND